MGRKEIGEMIERRYEMAHYLKDQLDQRKEYVVLNDVDINSVMFMYVGDKNNITMTVDEINEINKKIKQQMDKEGIYFLHQFSINDDNQKIAKDAELYPLRYMSGNDNISKQTIDNFITYIDEMIVQIHKN